MGLFLLLTQDLLATNLGNGDIDGAGVIELAGISSSSSGASGACRLSFSSVLLIAVTVLIIKVKKTAFITQKTLLIDIEHDQFIVLTHNISQCVPGFSNPNQVHGLFHF